MATQVLRNSDLSERELRASVREGRGHYELLICDNGETIVHAKGCGSQGGNVLAKIPVPPEWVATAFDRDKAIGRAEGYCGNCTAWRNAGSVKGLYRPRSERG